MTTHHDLVVTAAPDVPFVMMEREIDATVAQVYRAYTEPALLVQWMGPRGMAMDVTEHEMRVGGRWAFTHTDEEGNVYGFRGVFHQVLPNEQIVQTFEFDGYPGHVSLERVNLEDLGDRTLIRTHSVFQSQEDRDGMVASGMERGVREGYERLEELLGVRPTVS